MTRTDIINKLNSIDDDLRNIERTVDLLYKIQLSQGPLVQVVTIIKFEKPRLYPFLKKRFENNPGFKMLFDVDFEYETAKKSMGIYKKEKIMS
jgi:hypothetical protein